MMYRFSKLILFANFLFISKVLFAQEDLKIGQWKSYLPYRYARAVTQSDDKVFFAAHQSGVFSIDKNNEEKEFLSKVNGLNDAGIQYIKYNRKGNVLLVAYENGNIDLVKKNGDVLAVRDILNNLNIIGDKKIYDVYIDNATDAYLACGFGIVKLDMVKAEFDFTTFTNGKVSNISILNNYIYINTEKGLYSILNDKKLNIADFKQWSLLGIQDGFPKNYTCQAICSARNKLFLGINDTLFSWENKKLSKIQYIDNSHKVIDISAEGKNILYSFGKKDGTEYGGYFGYINPQNEANLILNNPCVNYIFNAIEDEKGNIWVADREDDFKRLDKLNGTTATCKTFKINAPYSSKVSEIAIAADNSLWVASGTVFNGVYQGNYDGFFRYKDNKWSYKNNLNEPIMAKPFPGQVQDCHTVAINKSTKKAYIGSFWNGIIEADESGKVLNHFTTKNCSLQTAVGDPNTTRVGGLAFDKKGTLWVANNLAPKPVVAYTADGKWYAMGKNLNSNQFIYQCVVDPINSFKWFAIGAGDGGILVYSEGKDIASENDDKFAYLTKSNSRLPSNKVNCLEVDLDGRVWVGTNDGVAYFSCGESLFDKKDACKGYTPTTVVDGIPEYLLKYNNVNTIAVDGANRKWFGTSNGFFIQSPDGTEQIAYYNTQNSPLFDDNVIDIAINNKTGEVYIATNKGLQSFKTDALVGGVTQGNILVYPNPVRPEYQGSIAIKGLAEDSKVKITDINGRLVYETEALGGQAIWDGNDYNGRKADTGVYYIFSTYTKNIDYPSDAAAKVLIVK